jgi:hypothetical protein
MRIGCGTPHDLDVTFEKDEDPHSDQTAYLLAKNKMVTADATRAQL